MQKTVLVLVSNPKGTSNLNLLPEIRDLQEALQRSQHRHGFSVEWRIAKTQKDLRRYVMDVSPHIIHFCGHGTTEGLVLEDDTGIARVVSNDVLTDFLQIFADRIECVLLNACYTESLAEQLSQHLNYVIGMNQAVYDDAAIAFSEGFYDAIGAGESYERAFTVGKNAVMEKVTASERSRRKITVIGTDNEPAEDQNQEHLIPVLKINPNPRLRSPLGVQLKLEDRQRKLKKLQERLQVIDQKIVQGVDFEEEPKLEARKDGIYQEITKLEAEINRLEQGRE
ncbi:MAG: hypothetical protein DCF15_17640 [Phormidesmis priestleyi]|uniref:CHAT domain-containing protein n=1 Tax=Phormidesmis priestleyi TaxID=268141 RepID=A0A2W4YRI6_9CYAN|nr:MAG: hypothetical protein DCF15_17640 [Phormidesmis priestleyi]